MKEETKDSRIHGAKIACDSARQFLLQDKYLFTYTKRIE